jgi:hypothetical protein
MEQPGGIEIGQPSTCLKDSPAPAVPILQPLQNIALVVADVSAHPAIRWPSSRPVPVVDGLLRRHLEHLDELIDRQHVGHFGEPINLCTHDPTLRIKVDHVF